MAYVLKFSFDGEIPFLDKYADLDCSRRYYLVPGNNTGSLVLASDLTITSRRKIPALQWNLESSGKGLYRILNCENNQKVLECHPSNHELTMSIPSGNDSQVWRIESAHGGVFRISNKRFPGPALSVDSVIAQGARAVVVNSENREPLGWKLVEVCDMKQDAYKQHAIPCTIEAEDFDIGCSGEAYFDRDETNEGGQYRLNGGVDIEKCAAGGYNVGWIHSGEMTAYTVTVGTSATYQISFHVASAYDSGRFHLECDGTDRTGVVLVPNTGGFQNWTVVKRGVNLDAGEHVLKFVADGDYFNFDKAIVEEMK
jgi:hypothetical protein